MKEIKHIGPLTAVITFVLALILMRHPVISLFVAIAIVAFDMIYVSMFRKFMVDGDHLYWRELNKGDLRGLGFLYLILIGVTLFPVISLLINLFIVAWLGWLSPIYKRKITHVYYDNNG